MRLVLTTLLLALALGPACGKKGDDSGGPTTGPTGTTSGTPPGTPTGTSTPNVVLTEGPVITCANPAVRATGHFEQRSASHPPADGSFTWGGGVISEDFDGDGTLDLIFAAQDGLQMWLTKPGVLPNDVEFEDVDAGLSALDLDYAVGGTPVDIDADGDMDLIVTRWDRPNALLINEGTSFTDATPQAWKAYSSKTQSASLGDMDGDGDLDLFFGSYGDKPDTFDDPTMPPADPAELYRNDGGTWVDVSNLLPQEAHDGYTFMSGWWHMWGDENPELVIANDFGKVRPSLIVRNTGAGASFSADTTFHPDWEDMGMAVADVNGDSIPDFLMSSWKNVSVLASGVAYGLPGTYVEVSDSWGIQADVANRNQVYGWGAEWGDLDNDADLDAMVIYSYWSAYTEAGDPLNQIDALYEQTGLLSFTQTGGEGRWSVNDGSRGRGLVFADLNDDGYLDVVKGHPQASSLLYVSRCGGNSWLRVRLQQNNANIQGVGARIKITTGSLTQTRWIQAGSSGMYSGGPLEAHFGTQARDLIDEIEVTWPDGKVHKFEAVGARKIVTITRNNAD